MDGRSHKVGLLDPHAGPDDALHANGPAGRAHRAALLRRRLRFIAIYATCATVAWGVVALLWTSLARLF